ncbi:hypothetical protein KKHLCK_04380 [Candidatus Electrothrix laxa]
MSKADFSLEINEEDIPIFIPIIGRRAFSETVLVSSITESDEGTQEIRDAQYEIVNEGVNVYIAALGYDQPLEAIQDDQDSQVHPTQSGYLEIAKRLGYSIQSYFDHVSNTPGLPDCIPFYIGPRVVEVNWDETDIVATIAHSTQASIPSAPKCTAPTYCGFRVFDDTTLLNIEVTQDNTPSTTVDGLEHTQYRIQLLDQQDSPDIALSFAYGAMNEINIPQIVDEAIESNDAENIVKQECLSTIPSSECFSSVETFSLPIQPALFCSQDGTFFNKLELELPFCSTQSQ